MSLQSIKLCPGLAGCLRHSGTDLTQGGKREEKEGKKDPTWVWGKRDPCSKLTSPTRGFKRGGAGEGGGALEKGKKKT